ncbi:MAG TPA: inositol monophosphatase family protein [Acidimicrobiales bacterium]|nr:inositol monophosphatase family protein [Acidimicrobiales bacterium]
MGRPGDEWERPAPGELLALGVEAARAAGRLLLDGLAAGATGVESKSTPTDPVSDLDRASEALIVRTLRGRRPDDAVLGEEGGATTGRSGVRWVVDPLDGTVNFLYGFPAFAVSVAAEVDGEVVVGVVHDPLRGETFTAEKGAGSWLGAQRLAVRTPADLTSALVGTGFAYAAATRARQGRIVAELLPLVRDIRRAGSAALDLCWVGAGRLDAYFESGTHHWDRAAGALVAAEAGAWTGDLTGGPPSDEMAVAAAPGIARDLLGRLRAAGA